MRASVIRIGNSRGIRIPKSFLVECGIEESVDLTVEDGRIVLSAPRQVRQGWAAAARELAQNGDISLIDLPVTTEFDQDEWEW
jgi:antitoxin MazE